MSRASAVVSLDEKYAVLVYGEDNGSSTKIVLLDAKTIGIQVFNREDDVGKKTSSCNIIDSNDGGNTYD